MKRASQSLDESVFLTSVDEETEVADREVALSKWNKGLVHAKAPELDQYVGKIKVPPTRVEIDREERRKAKPKKPGLPEAARGHRQDNATSGGKDKGEKSGKKFRDHFDTMLEKAEQIVAEEEARKEAANINPDETEAEKSL